MSHEGGLKDERLTEQTEHRTSNPPQADRTSNNDVAPLPEPRHGLDKGKFPILTIGPQHGCLF
jgi:hypothetical protein